MLHRRSETLVTEFLGNALARGALGVPELEARARAAGLLGERQRIAHAKVFQRAKKFLRIKSVRAGFGTGAGWLWELFCEADRASATSSITRQPHRTEWRVPIDW